MGEVEFKPNKTSFYYYPVILGNLILAVLLIILYFLINVGLEVSVLWFALAFLVLMPMSIVLRKIHYEKESYVFTQGKIIKRSGGIFSDSEVELVVKNMTHVTARLSFIQNKLFGTGNVNIESAGTGSAEIKILSVDNPLGVYDQIIKYMRQEGFKLKKDTLIQRERPSSLAIVLELFRGIGIVLVYGIIVFLKIFGNGINEQLVGLAIAGAIAGFTVIATIVFFRYMDLKKRVYELYSDTVSYQEGFLSKNYSVIPFENISDTNLNQTLVDKIFGLYDLGVSCQGSGQEIHFKNIRNGPLMEKNLKKMIESYTNKGLSMKKVEIKAAKVAATSVKIAAYKEKPLKGNEEFTANYKMDATKTLLPLVIFAPLLIIFPMAIIYAAFIVGGLFITVSATSYGVRAKSVFSNYNFLSKKNVEFSNDKIMAVTFRESLIDKFFKTCSVGFWSIGSSTNLAFRNIKKVDGMYPNILSKFGIVEEEPIYESRSKFSFIEMLKADLWGTILLSFLLVVFIGLSFFHWAFFIGMGAIVLMYISAAIYLPLHYARSKLTLFKDYILFEKGLIIKTKYYAPYSNIKDIETVRYPGSSLGNIVFNVAGEFTMQKNRGKFGAAMQSNNFKMNYVEGIENKDELLDLIFFYRPTPEKIKNLDKNIGKYSEKSLIVAKQDVSNSMAILIATSVVLFPLILLLPITIPIVIWNVKVKSYYVQSYRVVAKSGIFYKKQISVVLNKLDHINKNQGFFNKMFKNGNITINTAGSSKPEIVIKDVKGFNEFYEVLKSKY